MLEEEVARLRMENRALMNSLLGTAGFPPVEFAETVEADGVAADAEEVVAADTEEE